MCDRSKGSRGCAVWRKTRYAGGAIISHVYYQGIFYFCPNYCFVFFVMGKLKSQ